MKLVIDSQKNFSFGLKELWSFRELIIMLAKRDFKVRYSQTFFGLMWAFIQPFATMLIFILVFNVAIKIETHGLPYPAFVLSGMMAWSYFSFVFSQAGSSIINAQSIITKIYFPKLVIPISKTVVGMVDFFITFLLTILVLLFYHVSVSSNILLLPFFLLLLFVFSLAVGILISAISIRYRDVQNTIPFIAQLGLYITPVAYPSSLIPEKFQMLYFLNPMAGIVEGIRWAIFGSTDLSVNILMYTIVSTLVIFVVSIYYFRKVENSIADII